MNNKELKETLFQLIDTFTGNREVHTPYLVNEIIKLIDTQKLDLIAENKSIRLQARFIEEANDKLRRENRYMRTEQAAILTYIDKHLDPEWLVDIKQAINKSTL